MALDQYLNEQDVFLSTLSLRRATINRDIADGKREFLSTLSLRRATQIQRLKIPAHRISIHALLAESDYRSCVHVVGCAFLSTLSLRRATTLICDVIAVMTISIHALLAESDDHYVDNRTGELFISIHALLAESDCKRW